MVSGPQLDILYYTNNRIITKIQHTEYYLKGELPDST